MLSALRMKSLLLEWRTMRAVWMHSGLSAAALSGKEACFFGIKESRYTHSIPVLQETAYVSFSRQSCSRLCVRGLHFPRNSVFGGNLSRVFYHRGEPGIAEGEQGFEEFDMAEARALSQVWRQVGTAWHVIGPYGHDDFRFPSLDGLHARWESRQRGAAGPIHQNLFQWLLSKSQSCIGG
jgi:hypothetical protein